MPRVDISTGQQTKVDGTYTVRQTVTPSSAAPAHVGMVEVTTSNPVKSIPGPPGPAGPEGDKGDAGAGILMKGHVATSNDLPVIYNEQGHAYIVQEDDSLWVYDGTVFVSGGSIQGSQGDPGPPGPQGIPGPPGGLGEAPTDGQQYARQSSAWTVVEPGVSDWVDITGKPSTFPPTPAPDDNTLYGMRGTLWRKTAEAPLTSAFYTYKDTYTSAGMTSGEFRVNNTYWPDITKCWIAQSDLDFNNWGQVISSIQPGWFILPAQRSFVLNTFILKVIGTPVLTSGIWEIPVDWVGGFQGNINPDQGVNITFLPSGGSASGGVTISDTAPSSPSPGQLWWESDSGILYAYYTDANTSQWVQTAALGAPDLSAYTQKTAQTRNRIVNPAMQHSQENGDAASVVVNYYPADQWRKGGAAAVGVVGLQRVISVTPKGSTYRSRIYISTAAASPAASDSVILLQDIEGFKIADFQWGTAAAKPVVVSFGFRANLVGTYSLNLRSGDGSRSYSVGFTIAANTDTYFTFAVPGDTAGTWAKDNTKGLMIGVNIVAGSSSSQASGVWAAGNFTGVTGGTNGMSSTSNVFELFDVGLYLDPDNTGKAPPFETPDFAEEQAACLRYYRKLLTAFSGSTTSGIAYYGWVPFESPMRATPTLSGVNSYTSGFPTAAGTLTFTGQSVQEVRTANSTVTGGIFMTLVTASARM